MLEKDTIGEDTMYIYVKRVQQKRSSISPHINDNGGHCKIQRTKRFRIFGQHRTIR